MLERRSALAAHPLFQAARARPGSDAGGAGVTLAERRPLAVLQISAFAATMDDAGARLSAALGLALPAPNRYSGEAHCTLRATGPGIWQVVGDDGALPTAASLRAALAGVATVVDLTHARTALVVSGPLAARTLAKHCGMDLDPARFPTGSATNTRFGHIGMTLARTDDRPGFEVLVFRGYGEFVFEALAEAGAEFGLRVVA